MRQPDGGAVPEHLGHGTLQRLAGPRMDETEHHLARLAEGVLEGPAGQRFRHGVQQGDPAVRVRGHHRIPDTAQRHREQIALLAQGHLRLLACGDVLEGEENQGGPPFACGRCGGH